MSQKIRIGIIGTGGIAGAHIQAYQKMPDVEVIACSDIVPGKAEAFVNKFHIQGARAFSENQDLLALDLDGVSVCTPNAAHHPVTVDALTAGKHVLTEKPMSVTLDQALDMVRVAKRAGKLLTVGFQPRYDPNMQTIRDIVQSGVLGKIYYVQTGGGRRRGIPGGTFINKASAGAGALADIGCYSLDMALNALGYPKPLTVTAFSSNCFGTNPQYYQDADHFEVEDFGAAFIRLEGGVALNFQLSWAMHMDSLGPAIFLGADAGLRLTPAGTGPWSGVWDGGVGSITLFHDLLGHPTESPIALQHHSVDIFYEKVRAFIVAIRDGLSAPIPGEQIIRNQAIIDGIIRSADLGREVEIQIPEW